MAMVMDHGSGWAGMDEKNAKRVGLTKRATVACSSTRPCHD